MAMPRLERHADRLPVRADGSARYAVVADTHSQPHANAHRLLRELEPDAILHAGDIGALAVLDAGTLRILLLHIAVAGPRLRGDAAKLARAERVQLVVCGHSHVPFIGEDRGLTVFNPGSVGPRRFHLPIVFGTIELARGGGVRLAHVDAETGRAWLPPG